MPAGKNNPLVERRLGKTLTALYSLGEATNYGTISGKAQIIMELRRAVDGIEERWNAPIKRTATGRISAAKVREHE